MTSTWAGSALVERGGEVVAELVEGFADGPDGAPWSRGLRSQASSISKQVVAVVALALVERGEVRLDEPVGRWWGWAPSTWAGITLHHLLSQTSGVGHWAELGLAPLTGDPPERDDLAALVARTPLVDPPGTRWRYSSPGALVAALALEAAVQTPYATLAAELALGPAGMTSSTSGVFVPGQEPAAAGHHRGTPVYAAPGLAALPGTGDLWTTTADLLAWSRALRDGALLRRPELLWTPHAELPADATGGSRVVGEAYGYGTFLGTVLGRPAWYVPGDNPGYASLLAHLPDDATTVAVLVNDDDAGTEAALAGLEAELTTGPGRS